MGTLPRSDRWPPVKLAALAAGLAPAVWFAVLALGDGLGARALKQAVNLTGDWSIVLRAYLAIGAVALLGLAALAATSWDGAVRRLGAVRWNRLHRLALACALLSVIHFLLRSPTDTSEPMLLAGLLAWLAGFRLLRRRGEVGSIKLVALAAAAAALTALTETAWYAAATGIDPWRILAAHLDVGFGLRPAWWVLIAGLAAAALGGVAQRVSARTSASSAASGAMRGQSPS